MYIVGAVGVKVVVIVPLAVDKPVTFALRFAFVAILKPLAVPPLALYH